jgi:Mn-dependent DtxR family transcriptional regulator
MEITPEIAECVGLWLAEGDNKTNKEITFTNNSIELVLFFHETIMHIYSGKNTPKIYVYSPSPRKLFNSIGKIKINYYQDRRANRTYYIYRLADIVFIKEWHNIVKQVKSQECFYVEILRGIFAGEGNIKHIQKGNSRMVRIASGNRDYFIELLLKYFGVKYTYIAGHRCYWISASQLDKLDRIHISSLHPEKESKFRKMIDSVNNVNYPKHYLKKRVLSILDKFYRTQELANIFKQQDLRILEILRELKDDDKVDYVRRDKNTYWARKELISKLILRRKSDILKQLGTFKSINDIANSIAVYRKIVSKRLRTLEAEGLVKNVNKKWIRTEEGSKLICGVDESGRGLQKVCF